MPEFVTSTISAALLDASDVNRIAFWSPYGRGDGATLHATPHAVWFYTGIPVPLFNGVLSTPLDPDQVETTVQDLQARIDAQGAPALWWIGPGSRPEDLGPLLEQRGLQPSGHVPGMATDLRSLDEPRPVPGLSIEQVANREKQALWARIAALGTGFPEVAVEALVRVETSLADPQYQAQHRYIGYLDGTPVATSALVLEGGVAGIYAVATLPSARRRGIGSMMTLAPLLEAREMGHRVGILQASSMGRPIYRKMGFRDVCTYRIYLQS